MKPPVSHPEESSRRVGVPGGLTFGIYTPMQINVTCAQGGAGLAPVLFEDLAAELAGRESVSDD